MTTMDDWDDYSRFRDAFAGIMDQRFYTPEWLDGEIWAGRARMFATQGAGVVATLKIYPTGARELHYLVAAGALDECLAMCPMIEAWGRSLGCVTACFESREGWTRAMKGLGYEPYQSAARKELA